MEAAYLLSAPEGHIKELRQRMADAERENNKRLVNKYLREEGFKKRLSIVS
jgi:hypothetical protein